MGRETNMDQPTNKSDGVTVIIGASPNPDRYAFLAAELLQRYGHAFVPIGMKRGEVLGKEILDIRALPKLPNVNTVTLYIRPELQQQWADYILSLQPKRIIFNPGTENLEFEQQANSAGIEAIEACTLVMLKTGQY
jgi:uncharacterized protein